MTGNHGCGGLAAAVVAALWAGGAGAWSPEVCDALAGADLGGILTGGAELAVSGPVEYSGLRVVNCTFGPPLGPTLFVNVARDVGGQMPDSAAEAAAREAENVRLMGGADAAVEEIGGLGAAAFWDPLGGLLHLWPADGNVVVTLGTLGIDDPKAAAEAAARAILPVLPGEG